MEEQKMVVDSEESVARLLCSEWVEDGEISVDAFALAPRETYLSVNRPSVSTYDSDVIQFVSNHQDYVYAEKNEMAFRAAMMNVGEIRGITVEIEDGPIDLDVEIEARDAHTKSHAGIFVRTNGKNIVKGRPVMSASIPKGISSDDILQEVQWSLKEVALLEIFKLVQPQENE